MSYFYVKSGGTATNDGGKYSTPKTGSWSTAFTLTSQYYNSVYTLVYTYSSQLLAGDTIFVSNLHNKTGTISGVTNTTYPIGCKILCVNDSDLSQLSTGGKEQISNYWLNAWAPGCYFYGVDLNREYSLYLMSDGFTADTIFENCTINSYMYIGIGNGSGDTYGTFIFRNCTITKGVMITGGLAIFLNCSFTNTASTQFSYYNSYSDSRNVGGQVHAVGCSFAVTSYTIFSNSTAVSADYYHHTTQGLVERCSIAASSPQLTSTVNSACLEYPYKVHLCGTTGEKYFTEVHKYGVVTGNTSVYRNNGARIESVTPYSLKIVMSPKMFWDNIEYKGKYIRIKIAEFIWDFTNFVECRIEVLQVNSSVTFKKDQVWAEMVYPDLEDSKYNFLTTKGNLVTNNDAYPMSSEVWTGLSGPVAQYIPLITNRSGREGLCTIWLYCNIYNLTFYACPKLTILKAS